MTTAQTETGFRECVVEADGFNIRYFEKGEGSPLVHIPGGHGVRISRAHVALAETHRVIVVEMPGFGSSSENTRTESLEAFAQTALALLDALGLDEVDLMGTSFGGKLACWIAILAPDRIRSLVLESPGAIRPPDWSFPQGQAQDQGDPDRAKMRALVMRLLGPNRDTAFEERLQALATPTVVLFGTTDHTIAPERIAHIYKQILPDCHLVFVYDAGHEIGASRPEAFVDVVDDFLERHATFVVSRRPTVLFP